MTVKELMERANISQTGRALAYIKDGMEELNVLFETHTNTQRNDKDEYRSIPRMIYQPIIKDADDV